MRFVGAWPANTKATDISMPSTPTAAESRGTRHGRSTPGLVRRQPPRPALAPHLRTLPRLGLGRSCSSRPRWNAAWPTSRAGWSASRMWPAWPWPTRDDVLKLWEGLGYYSQRPQTCIAPRASSTRTWADASPTRWKACWPCPAWAPTRLAPWPASPLAWTSAVI